METLAERERERGNPDIVRAIFSPLISPLRPPKNFGARFIFFYFTAAFHVIVKTRVSSLKEKSGKRARKKQKQKNTSRQNPKVVKNYMYWPTASARLCKAMEVPFFSPFSIVSCGVSFFLFSRGKNTASHNTEQSDIGNHRTENVTNSTGT